MRFPLLQFLKLMIMEEMNKGKESESVKQHVQPNVRIHEKINGASEQIKNLFEDIRKEEKIQLETVEGIKAEIVPIIEEAAKNPDIYYLFEEMQEKNEYTYKHNIGVGIIATYLGTKLGLSKESLSDLTLAAILQPFYKVIEQMNRDVFGKFNPKMLLVFINQLMGTLVGKEVMLTNQQIGTIIMINPYEPLKVLMKTNSGILDLRLEKELQIERIIGK
ncbi:hypothetical protein [Peribacillus butanolivorans]